MKKKNVAILISVMLFIMLIGTTISFVCGRFFSNINYDGIFNIQKNFFGFFTAKETEKKINKYIEAFNNRDADTINSMENLQGGIKHNAELSNKSYEEIVKESENYGGFEKAFKEYEEDYKEDVVEACDILNKNDLKFEIKKIYKITNKSDFEHIYNEDEISKSYLDAMWKNKLNQDTNYIDTLWEYHKDAINKYNYYYVTITVKDNTGKDAFKKLYNKMEENMSVEDSTNKDIIKAIKERDEITTSVLLVFDDEDKIISSQIYSIISGFRLFDYMDEKND